MLALVRDALGVTCDSSEHADDITRIVRHAIGGAGYKLVPLAEPRPTPEEVKAAMWELANEAVAESGGEVPIDVFVRRMLELVDGESQDVAGVFQFYADETLKGLGLDLDAGFAAIPMKDLRALVAGQVVHGWILAARMRMGA